MLPEHQVLVEVLKKGKWAQEPWKPQLEVFKGNRVTISISLATELKDAGMCRIVETSPHLSKQVKVKSEGNPVKKDKKAAEG